MSKINEYVALFDLDGVVLDTESQYTVFWDKQGLRYLNISHFCSRIKGQTLMQIFEKYFPKDKNLRNKIRNELGDYERNMTFNYIPGADKFIKDIRYYGVRTALVTSSNNDKMINVYHKKPEFKDLFDVIVTSDMFTHSKPDPECFLTGMYLLQSNPAHALVFEDSFHGLKAGKNSKAYVIGLATTNSRMDIEGKANYVIDDFIGLNCKWLKNILKCE